MYCVCICICICILYLQKLYLVGQVSLRGLCRPTALYKSVAPIKYVQETPVHFRIRLSEKYDSFINQSARKYVQERSVSCSFDIRLPEKYDSL